MGAAVAVVADVVYSAVVSKLASEVVSEVAGALGASDKTANLLGGIAGIAAGGSEFTQGRASGWLRETTGAKSIVNPFIAAPTGGPEAPSGDVVAPSGAVAKPADMSGVAGTELPESIAGSEAASKAYSAATTPAAPADKAPWYKSIWEGGKTGEIAAGFVSGAAQGYMGAAAAEDARKAEEEREEDYYDRWKKFNPQAQMPQMQYPSVAETSAPSGMLSYPIPGYDEGND